MRLLWQGKGVNSGAKNFIFKFWLKLLSNAWSNAIRTNANLIKVWGFSTTPHSKLLRFEFCMQTGLKLLKSFSLQLKHQFLSSDDLSPLCMMFANKPYHRAQQCCWCLLCIVGNVWYWKWPTKSKQFSLRFRSNLTQFSLRRDWKLIQI